MGPAASELRELLRALRPVRHPGTFAFCTLPDGSAVPPEAVGWFREAEGVSVVLPADAAQAAGLPVGFEAAWITLTIRSSLSAVGLTAAVTAVLAGAGVSCNVIAGYHHDHLFVPAGRAAEAVALLDRLQSAAARPDAAPDRGEGEGDVQARPAQDAEGHRPDQGPERADRPRHLRVGRGDLEAGLAQGGAAADGVPHEATTQDVHRGPLDDDPITMALKREKKP